VGASEFFDVPFFIARLREENLARSTHETINVRKTGYGSYYCEAQYPDSWNKIKGAHALYVSIRKNIDIDFTDYLKGLKNHPLQGLLYVL
jgi:hypothetical protein